MGTLTVLRHGQASFGAANYDQLSAKGLSQAQALGRWWSQRGQRFDQVWMGGLARHRQTWDGVVQGAGPLGHTWPEAAVLPVFNEYDPEALLACLPPEEATVEAAVAAADAVTRQRHHFRRLKRALALWMAAEVAPIGMPAFSEFEGGLRDFMDRCRLQALGQQVLVVSSGGPMSVMLKCSLGLDAAATIGLNMRVHNTALSQWAFNPKRHELLCFNSLPHLAQADAEGLITSA